MTMQRAVVTGAGQGMGRSIALKFAANGIHVVLVGRTKEKLQNVATEISALGAESTIFPLDVTDNTGVQKLADSLDGNALDILVNCAGDWLIKPIDETTDADLDHILGVNLKAPYMLVRALLPNLRRSDNASIVNIGSMAAMKGIGGISAYTASKWGLRGLTESLAAELKPHAIRVVMLSPSPANTPMRWDATPNADPATLVEPETIADMVWGVVSLPPGIVTSNFTLESLSFGI